MEARRPIPWSWMTLPISARPLQSMPRKEAMNTTGWGGGESMVRGGYFTFEAVPT